MQILEAMPWWIFECRGCGLVLEAVKEDVEYKIYKGKLCYPAEQKFLCVQCPNCLFFKMVPPMLKNDKLYVGKLNELHKIAKKKEDIYGVATDCLMHIQQEAKKNGIGFYEKGKSNNDSFIVFAGAIQDIEALKRTGRSRKEFKVRKASGESRELAFQNAIEVFTASFEKSNKGWKRKIL